MQDIIFGVVFFTAIVLLLALFVMAARRVLVPSGSVTVTLNGEKKLTAQVGSRLLGVLADAGVQLPSACGGAGTCGLCKVTVEGDDEPGPTERARLSQAEVSSGVRLACQVALNTDAQVSVPDEAFGISTWACTVEGTHNVSTRDRFETARRRIRACTRRHLRSDHMPAGVRPVQRFRHR
ncbi:2Fe-2S iron-sulfur cluster-binding protein [Pseudomonadota bacterium]